MGGGSEDWPLGTGVSEEKREMGGGKKGGREGQRERGTEGKEKTGGGQSPPAVRESRELHRRCS